MFDAAKPPREFNGPMLELARVTGEELMCPLNAEWDAAHFIVLALL
jgi:hypothetical protein